MKHPTKVFDEWALVGKDEGMEKSHAASVSEILDYALDKLNTKNQQFTFLDIGCGNGWVAEQLSKNKNCKLSWGIDGAENMILNANKRQSKAVFSLNDINDFEIKHKFDQREKNGTAIEVRIYAENPQKRFLPSPGLLNKFLIPKVSG